MNNMRLACILLISSTIISSCKDNIDTKVDSNENVEDTLHVDVENSDAFKQAAVDIEIAGIHFTKSVNNADKLLNLGNGTVKFESGPESDFFSDPNGKLTKTSAPILLTKVDNTKPFSFTSKVAPGFTDEGQFNAAVLYLFVNEGLYQKLCFEQDERKAHRVVTVRTNGTSDDNNHDILTSGSVYLKYTSDTKTIASYYSLDKKNWQMVRLYKNDYPKEIFLGISSQCPLGKGTVSEFEDIEFVYESVSDIRLGK